MLKTYAVFHRRNSSVPWQVFMCEAEDRDHAIEQHQDANPDTWGWDTMVMVKVPE